MPDSEHSVAFETLTPLWTGDATGRSDKRILETGILGSLRWWTELLARGAGCDVPDPTAGKANEHCPVSKIFGHTAARREFRLIVEELDVKRCEVPEVIADEMRKSAPIYPNTGSAPYPGRVLMGHFQLRLITHDRESAAILPGVLRFIECCGGLGAKTQMGLGMIRTEGPIDVQPMLRWLNGNRRTPPQGKPRLPSLRNYFYATLRADSAKAEDTLQLKSRLRRAFAHVPAAKQRELFGNFSMSLPVADQIRVFGWIPEHLGRQSCLDIIKRILPRLTDCAVWFASGGDFVPELRKVLRANSQ